MGDYLSYPLIFSCADYYEANQELLWLWGLVSEESVMYS